MSSELKKTLHEELVKASIVRSCLNCENFKEEDERCSLAPSYPLPAKVVVYGCLKWIMVIPF